MNFQVSIKIFLAVILGLIIANLVFVNLSLFGQNKPALPYVLDKLPTPTSESDFSCSSCGAECKKIVEEALAEYKSTVSASLVASPTPIKTKTLQREFFVGLGGGSSKASDWDDMLGVEASIDSTQYGQIKQVFFEASVFIPNGNQKVYVRLYNVTDKHPVWFSEVSLEGGTPQLLISPLIKLDNGNKLYRVQMKTSLGQSADLIQSRVKIISLEEN